jgi:hypothetical protein
MVNSLVPHLFEQGVYGAVVPAIWEPEERTRDRRYEIVVAA